MRSLWSKPWWLAAALLAALVVGAFVVHEHFAPLDEVAQWATGSDVHELGHTPAPPPGEPSPRVLVFALDGVGRDNFPALLEPETPLATLVGDAQGEPASDESDGVYSHACQVRDALSILPSTTIAAWTSTLTGRPVAETGVAGNEWFIREEARFVAPAPVSVRGHEDTLSTLNDGLLGELLAVETVYERIEGRSHASLIPLYRGADAFTVPNSVALSGMFGAFVEGIAEHPEFERAVYEEVDESSLESVAEAFETHGIPDLQVVYFPGIDLYTHGAEHPLEDQRAYLSEVTAPAIARVLAMYEEAEALDDTTVIVISDHGHTPVINDDRHALSIGGSDEPSAVLEAQGFRVRAPVLETESADFSAVLAYQGAIAYVYLADRSTCPDPGDECDWARPPRFEEDVLPVARAFAAASEEEDAEGGLVGALDLVFTRRPSTPPAPFAVLGEGGELVELDDYLRETPRPEYLRLADRVRAMSEGPRGDRVGDVMLLARAGLHEAIEDRFYFSSPYRSWHGSPAASDSRITFVVASPQRTGAQLCEVSREVTGSEPSQRHLTPLIERLLRR